MTQVSTRHSAALCTGSEQHAEATIISIILSANKIRQEISLVLLLLKRTGPESKKKGGGGIWLSHTIAFRGRIADLL